MMPTSRLSFQYHVALDVGTAWTRAANPGGARFSIETQRRKGAPPPLALEGPAASRMIEGLLKALRPHFFWRPKVVAAISSCANERERHSFLQTLYQGGAGEVTLVPQPFAAAVGAGLDPSSQHAQMIIDIGESFTELALIRSGRVEQSESLQFGCQALKQVIARHLRPRPGARPGHDALLHWMGTHSLNEAIRRGMIPPELAMEIRTLLGTVADGALRFYRRLPDRVACEVIENGITLVGGGAMLTDLRAEMAMRTGLTIHVPCNPLTSVIDGVTKVIPYASLAAS